MISEKDICELFSSMLPSGRQNACFESDSEIIEFPAGSNGLFTTDEFSAEDLFREDDPYLLGWNIAAGAISDILACGGTPMYYAHALTVAPHWDLEYLRQLGTGVRDVLNATGTRFIGGDCGRSELWRCTATVIGACEGKPLRRLGATEGDLLYLSGEVGSGNLEAALRLRRGQNAREWETVRTQFPLRVRESSIVKQFAACCMDTSDGLCAALHTLADLNACGFTVSNVPYLAAGSRFCQQSGLPRTLLFFAGCGEYELLCTIRPEHEPSFLAEARKFGCTFHRLGRITPAGRELVENSQRIDLDSWRPQGRDFESPAKYVTALLSWLKQQSSTIAEKSVR